VKRLIRAVVDTAALRANLAAVRRFAPKSKVMAVVKANAYGHGLVPTALALPDADAFAVARLEEGMALRSAGVRSPIVLLEGVFDAGQLAEAAAQNFELVVHNPDQLALLAGWRG
jgi:alanine racemase